MRALLDINVLIALLDKDHIHHKDTWGWFSTHVHDGWASCPITQNGCVRILSQPGYPNPLPTAIVAERLAEATATQHHEFWPDNISLFDKKIIDPARLLSPRQVTDTYLLALSVTNGGRFVTFDRGVPLASVKGAGRKHLVIL